MISEQLLRGDGVAVREALADALEDRLDAGLDREGDLDRDVRAASGGRTGLLGVADGRHQHVLEVETLLVGADVGERERGLESIEGVGIGRQLLEHLSAILLRERVKEQIEVQNGVDHAPSDARLGVSSGLFVTQLAFAQQERAVGRGENPAVAVDVGVHNRIPIIRHGIPPEPI